MPAFISGLLWGLTSVQLLSLHGPMSTLQIQSWRSVTSPARWNTCSKVVLSWPVQMLTRFASFSTIVFFLYLMKRPNCSVLIFSNVDTNYRMDSWLQNASVQTLLKVYFCRCCPRKEEKEREKCYCPLVFQSLQPIQYSGAFQKLANFYTIVIFYPMKWSRFVLCKFWHDFVNFLNILWCYF